MKKQGELKEYKCSLDGEHWMSFNATSSGKAKMQFFNYLEGDYNYLYIKCKVGGKIYTSDEFKRNAKYRNIEFAYCGMVVEVDGKKGIIVGHNSSANLNVWFTEGKYKDQVMNCHPNWKITYFKPNGEIIKQFDDSRMVS